MRETSEGHVVDIACVRRYPHSEIAARAADHTRSCALMGHCMESGYGLVDRAGRIRLLDDHATLQIAEELKGVDAERMIRLRVIREKVNDEMRTVEVGPID